MTKRPFTPGHSGRALALSTVVACFSVGLVAIAVSLSSSFANAKRREDERFLAAMRMKGIAVETQLEQAKRGAGRMTSYMKLRQDVLAGMTTNQNQNATGFVTADSGGSARSASPVSRADALLLDTTLRPQQIAGITRIDPNGQQILQVGPRLSAEVLRSAGTEPVKLGDDFFLIYAFPITNQDGTEQATDYLAIELASLKKAFTTPANIEAKEETILGVPGRDGENLAFSDGGSVKALRDDSSLARLLTAAQNGNVGLEHLNSAQGTAQVIAYGPVKGTGWGLAMVADETQLYAPFYRGLFRDSVLLVVGLAMLTAFAGIGVHLVTGRRVIKHLRQQDATLAERNSELKRELDARKVAEAQLIEVNSSLESLVDERTSELSESNRALTDELTRRATLESGLREALGRAEVATRAKSELLANVSHELRTPLTAILGFSEIIGSAKSASDDVRDMVGSIKKNADSLVRLVDDLLDLGRSEAGQGFALRRERVAVTSLLHDLEQTFEQAAALRNIGLTIHIAADVPAEIESDGLRIKQILSNLIGNAIKFTEQGSVTVTCEQRKPFLSFRVSDSGAGIAPEKQATIFEPFYQVDASLSRRQSGAGLGLTLARQLARALGGDVVLAVSTPGKGSEFLATIRTTIPEQKQNTADTQPWLSLVRNDPQTPSPIQ